MTGKPEPKKLTAKQSAAFDLCLLLRRNQLLDDHFRSIYHKRLPAMRNARLAIVSKKTNKYTMRCKPSIWAQEEESSPESLFGMLIKLIPSQPLAREHRDLILLTRRELPGFPAFPVFLENDKEAQVHTILLKPALCITSEELQQLTDFTVSVFNDLFHKSFDPVPGKFPYWVAPIKSNIKIATSESIPRHIIDWVNLKFVHDNPELIWSRAMSHETLLSQFIYDPWDGRKRYFPIAIDHSLRPSDPPPEWVPRRKWMENIANYSLSLSKNSRSRYLDKCDWAQPVIRVECLSYRRNFLDKATETEKSETLECFICPQPLRISAVTFAL